MFKWFYNLHTTKDKTMHIDVALVTESKEFIRLLGKVTYLEARLEEHIRNS